MFVFASCSASRIAELRVTRHGTYGSLQQDWTAGFPATARPGGGYERGVVTPNGGTLLMGNAVQSDLIQVLVRLIIRNITGKAPVH